MEVNRKQLLFAGFSLVFTCGVFLATVKTLELMQFENDVHRTSQQNSEIEQNRGVSQQQDQLPPESVNQRKKGCALLRRVGDKLETVFGPNCHGKIVRWENYIFFSEVTEYKPKVDSNVILFSYDINTGEKKEIYNLDEHRDEFLEEFPYVTYEVAFLDVIEGRLYFSLGGYVTGSILYSFDLPPVEGTTELVAKDFITIEHRDGRYWLYDAFGDACVGSNTRAVFDINTGKIGKKLTVQQGCNEGEDVIGASDKEIYIKKYFQQNIVAVETEGIPTPPTIQEIYSLDIDTLKKKRVIFSAKNFPGVISDALYLYDKQVFLFLVNGGLAFYSPQSSRLEKIIDMNWVAVDSYLGQIGDRICLDWNDEVDLENKKIIKDQEDCQQAHSDDSIPEQIEQFNLPKEYLMEVTY